MVRSKTRSEAWYQRPGFASLFARSSREHIIGVSVNDTIAETRIVALSLMANSRNKRPTISPMNSSGISTAINETVSEMMVNPICSAPFSAACIGLSPSSI